MENTKSIELFMNFYLKFTLFIVISLSIFALIVSPFVNTKSTHTDSSQNAKLPALNEKDPAKNNEQDIVKNNEKVVDNPDKSNVSNNPPAIELSPRQVVINRAKTMADVKWVPEYDIPDRKASFVFKKGKTYYGIPYSMDSYQASSADDFLAKIKGSKSLYGNDCSGFVSAAWGISRQTTLSLYNAAKRGTKVDGKSVCQIAWKDLKEGDALLLDNGNGKGHIMLFISYDPKNSDKINVYEQNIKTDIPYEPIPVAREDARSVKALKSDGYFPIRLMGFE
ncbi:MAG TPA: hypothetical protein VF941_09435 [Clostridia bacterium]